jgi:hypothetical protein
MGQDLPDRLSLFTGGLVERSNRLLKYSQCYSKNQRLRLINLVANMGDYFRRRQNYMIKFSATCFYCTADIVQIRTIWLTVFQRQFTAKPRTIR